MTTPDDAQSGHASMRPGPDDVATSADISQWYWTRTQLDQIARRLGVSRSGDKQALSRRLIEILDGRPPPDVNRSPATEQLRPPFGDQTVIPEGQRLTRNLREYFVAHVGTGFRFDRHMRALFADPDGRTLGDAVRHWEKTRGTPTPEIEPQFEFNRFTRWFRSAHPNASRGELSVAWQDYKNTPRSQRPELPT